MLRNPRLLPALLLPLSMAMSGCIYLPLEHTATTLDSIDTPLAPSGEPAEARHETVDWFFGLLLPPYMERGRKEELWLYDPNERGRVRADLVADDALKFLRKRSRRDSAPEEAALALDLLADFEDFDDGTSRTHVIISYDPTVVVVLPTPSAPIARANAFWTSGGLAFSYAPGRPISIANGYFLSRNVGPEAPIAWYSPTRAVGPTVIAPMRSDLIELNTGRERIALRRIGGEWVASRARIDSEPADP